MSLRFLRNNHAGQQVVDSVRFYPHSKKFVLRSGQEPDLEYYFDFPFEKNSSYSHLKDAQFDVYLFHNSDFAANDIYHVSDCETRGKANLGRLGFLIPIQSLLTSEHDFGENEHFLPYAYHAIRILLTGRESPTTAFVDLESIYGENTHVLIIHKPYIKIWELQHGDVFKAEFFFPCLWKYGYLHINQSNFKVLYHDRENGSDAENPYNNRLELVSIAPKLRSNPFIINLFTSFLYDQKHEFIRFHLMYQVIELLIEKVFQNQLGTIIEDFSNDIDNFYDIREQLSKVANEKSRLKKLFAKFCTGQNTSLDRLQDSCNELLTKVNAKYEQNSPTNALYKVRSVIFHSFRVLPSDYIEKLKTINDDFEELIISAILNFKYPE